ncbi:preprotein translocase subunit SecY [Candidatus Annandia adelgestsuga]|uniref:Preprotein translocase subunit SecY n=1 Tax=Candidatus Annandia adelgestsuga TaxID=1302411 RepID=A0A3Q9CLT4_9ENTR|nr:hypothetical protein [Candidatus Annandia adelgestsuga]AZP36202.1 preprotein translocase subunit SecY [Candidatus Annandia adelgestsuga]
MKINKIKNRFYFLIFSIIILRIGSYIPIPTININNFNEIINYNNNNNIIKLLNIFYGDYILHASIFSLGLIPYIMSSIFIQTLNLLNKKIFSNKIDNVNNNFIINQYIKYTTLILSIIQSTIITHHLLNSNNKNQLIIYENIFITYLITVISLVTSTIFLVWLSKNITKYGFGNGVSFIICINILSKLFYYLIDIINKIKLGNIKLLNIFIINIVIFFIIFFIILIENGYKNIIVNFISIKNYKFKKNIYLPFKINMSGIIPAIVSYNILFIIKIIFNWYIKNNNYNNFVYNNIYLQLYQIIYIFFYIFVIFISCFIYNNILFNNMEISKYFKKSDIIIPGIMPGLKTKIFIYKIIKKITFINFLYISIICLIPEFINYFIEFPYYFNGISFLIVIVTIMECIKQIKTILLCNKYKYKKIF